MKGAHTLRYQHIQIPLLWAFGISGVKFLLCLSFEGLGVTVTWFYSVFLRILTVFIVFCLLCLSFQSLGVMVNSLYAIFTDSYFVSTVPIVSTVPLELPALPTHSM